MAKQQEWEFGFTGAKPIGLYVGITKNGFSFGREVCDALNLKNQETWHVFLLKKPSTQSNKWDVAFLFTNDAKSVPHDAENNPPVKLYFTKPNFAVAAGNKFIKDDLKLPLESVQGRHGCQIQHHPKFGKLLVTTLP